MRVSYSESEKRLGNEVRQWLAENMPPEIKDQTLGGSTLEPDLMIKWHKTLYKKGWIAPELPEALGGTGLNETEQFIFNYEFPFHNRYSPDISTSHLILFLETVSKITDRSAQFDPFFGLRNCIKSCCCGTC